MMVVVVVIGCKLSPLMEVMAMVVVVLTVVVGGGLR